MKIDAVEQMKLECVRFGELSLKPERWKLECDGEHADVLGLLTTMTAAQNDQFERFLEQRCTPNSEVAEYFPVHFDGVRDHVTSMRFGRCRWRPIVGGQVQHELTFVGERGDSHKFLGINEPETTRLIENVTKMTVQLKLLLGELQSSGHLSSETARRISEATHDFRDRREFGRDMSLPESFDERWTHP